VFHFYEKNREFVRCEIHAQPHDRWEIVITEPGGHERTEHFTSSEVAHARWRELQTRFIEDGWFGPYGRE